jgi:diguanylate cyclase (GGDEF)-like protein/PAS domain S-box-containing protein
VSGATQRLTHEISKHQFTQNIGQHRKADDTIIDVSVLSRALSYDGHQARLAVIHDITKVTLAEGELRRTKKFLDAVIEHVPLPIIVKDVTGLSADARDSRFTLFNRAYEELTGESRIQLIGRTAHQIFPKERADLIVRSDNEALRSDEVVITSEHEIYTSHNGTRLVTAKKTAIRDENGKPQYLLSVVDDVTERRHAEERISYLAHTDSLTSLPNRATIAEYLAETLDRASKSGEQFAVLCIDLDEFKEVNDDYGHLVGDELLREAARRLQAAVGNVFLARVGGDEFTLVVKNGAQPATAESLGENMLAAFQDEFEIDRHRLHLGLSIGGAVYPTDGTDAKALLVNADAALYQAKTETCGSLRFFESKLGAQLRERRDLEHDLKEAINRGEFLLHYQPQHKIASNETVGFEALVRWQCPKRGLVAPAKFIPVVEESGLIIPLGEWVLREACREAASWLQPLTIAVNISPIQFRHGDLPRLVHLILLETGLAPGRLELEITEGVLIDDFSRAVSILRKLKSLGVQIAMDDFGSGYSSLAYLHSFAFDKIKIDQTFISDLEHNHHSKAIIRAIINLGHSLDVPVLAEGVETEGQRLYLAQEGCDEVQGYLQGRPLPIADYAKLVGRQAIAEQNSAVAG